jgi:hypothetical protein
VKNPTVAAKKLTALLRKLDSGRAPAHLPHPDDPIAVLIFSFLLWESTTDKAMAAYARLFEHLVDYNDLRVSLPHETADILGPRYPRVLDRCQRLRAALRTIYIREHAVNLNILKETGKRDARRYIESLEGIVPYVAARLLLLSLDTHAIPVDDQLRTQLIETEVGDASIEIPELSNWLASQIKAEDGVTAHYALQAWIDELAGRAERKASAGAQRKSLDGKRLRRGAARSNAG